jgi:hypothetical protein
MKAYKGFYRHEDGTLRCRDFQYEIGKTYKFEGEPKLCEQGFHACHEPWQCWVFYPNIGRNVYYEVECGGKIVESNHGDGKFVCTEIKLIKEIAAPENKFDWCGSFYYGYAEVRLNGKWNFIDTKGKYLSEQWFDNCGVFNYGYAKVWLNGKWNYINTKGKYLSEQWFDYGGSFSDGYALVGLNDKYNYIDTDGKLISEQWWENGHSFCYGYAEVRINGEWYQIDTNGKISKQ